LSKEIRVKSGKLYALIGASRSGKTQQALELIKGKKSGLIWDVEEQYECDHRARTQKELVALVQQYGGKRGVIAFTGRLSDFGFFCKAAFIYVKICAHRGVNSFAVFEETADVTNPSKAPDEYGILLRRGLKYGVDIIAITQRPAESDKTAVGNASMVHICRLQLPTDIRYVARMTGVPEKTLNEMRADQDLSKFDFVTVDTGRKQWQRGCLTFPRGRPKFGISTGWTPI
tara:strand:+ start:4173 stop:4862 length:690 start_codon:yes stop_codon:yes gene_type:complete